MRMAAVVLSMGWEMDGGRRLGTRGVGMLLRVGDRSGCDPPFDQVQARPPYLAPVCGGMRANSRQHQRQHITVHIHTKSESPAYERKIAI